MFLSGIGCEEITERFPCAFCLAFRARERTFCTRAPFFVVFLFRKARHDLFHNVLIFEQAPVTTLPIAARPSCRIPHALSLYNTGTYVTLMGAYRALYILNWVYRSHHEYGYQHHPLVYAAGIVQTGMYLMFLVDRRVRCAREYLRGVAFSFALSCRAGSDDNEIERFILCDGHVGH